MNQQTLIFTFYLAPGALIQPLHLLTLTFITRLNSDAVQEITGAGEQAVNDEANPEAYS